MTPGEFAVGPWIQVCHDCRFFLYIQEKYTYWLSHSHLVNKRNYKCNYFEIYSNDISNPQEKAHTGSNSQLIFPILYMLFLRISNLISQMKSHQLLSTKMHQNNTLHKKLMIFLKDVGNENVS